MGEGSISNTYELFTALKTGSYEFATSADGGALIQAATITVDGGESLVPYRIRVNFDEATPVVSVLKVDEVILWAPSKKYVITNLEYVGIQRSTTTMLNISKQIGETKDIASGFIRKTENIRLMDIS